MIARKFRLLLAIIDRLPRRSSKRRRSGGEKIELGKHWFGAPFYDDDDKPTRR